MKPEIFVAWSRLVLPILAGMALLMSPLMMILRSTQYSFNCQNDYEGCDFSDETWSQEILLEEENGMTRFEERIEAFLRHCLVAAVLVFLYASFLLQQTMMEMGMIHCRQSIRRWNQLVCKISRRVTINL